MASLASDVTQHRILNEARRVLFKLVVLHGHFTSLGRVRHDSCARRGFIGTARVASPVPTTHAGRPDNMKLNCYMLIMLSTGSLDFALVVLADSTKWVWPRE